VLPGSAMVLKECAQQSARRDAPRIGACTTAAAQNRTRPHDRVKLVRLGRCDPHCCLARLAPSCNPINRALRPSGMVHCERDKVRTARPRREGRLTMGGRRDPS
jgi:hypothetical protein